MNPVYYDTTYLLKLQITELGSAEVRAHAATALEIHTAHHGHAEFVAAAFRKVREGIASIEDFRRLMAQFHSDVMTTTLCLLPLTGEILNHIEAVFASALPTTFLRAADAIHLATAAAHGFTEIYSNDKHLLTAAPLFGLKGVNVIH